MLITICTAVVGAASVGIVMQRFGARDEVRAQQAAQETAAQIGGAVNTVFQGAFDIVATTNGSLVGLKDEGITDPKVYDAVLKTDGPGAAPSVLAAGLSGTPAMRRGNAQAQPGSAPSVGGLLAPERDRDAARRPSHGRSSQATSSPCPIASISRTFSSRTQSMHPPATPNARHIVRHAARARRQGCRRACARHQNSMQSLRRSTRSNCLRTRRSPSSPTAELSQCRRKKRSKAKACQLRVQC